MNAKLLVAIVLLLIPTPSGLAQSRMCVMAATTDLVAVFQQRSADDMLRCINKIGSDYRGVDSALFLGDLWDRNQDKYGAVSWDIVDSERVRTGIASVLLLAHLQGRVKRDVGALHAYLRQRLDSGDPEVVARAATALQLLDDPTDVEPILAAASRDTGVIFQASTIALSAMCNPSAGAALDRLLKNVADEGQKTFIRDTRTRFQGLRTGSGSCGYS